MSLGLKTKLSDLFGNYESKGEPSRGYWWIILFIAISVTVAVCRLELWPLSTYSMFNSGQMNRQWITVLRPAVLRENSSIEFIPFALANRWNREKYFKALREKRPELIKVYLMQDCEEYFKHGCFSLKNNCRVDRNAFCSGKDLVLVRRRLKRLKNGGFKEFTNILVKYSDL